MYIQLNHFAIHQKLAQCKLTIIQLKKEEPRRSWFHIDNILARKKRKDRSSLLKRFLINQAGYRLSLLWKNLQISDLQWEHTFLSYTEWWELEEGTYKGRSEQSRTSGFSYCLTNSNNWLKEEGEGRACDKPWGPRGCRWLTGGESTRRRGWGSGWCHVRMASNNCSNL